MAEIRKQCIICGIEYSARKDSQKCCSTACATIYNDTTLKGNVIRQACKQCGNVFYAIGRKPYCSKECRDAAIEEERRKYKPKDSLGKKLEYCKKMGISYAQYQTIMTMESIRNEEGNGKGKI